MKSLLISALLVAVLVIMVVRPWTRGGSPTDPGAEREFLARCAPVAAARARPAEFCRCLFERGVRRPAEILTAQEGRAAAAECEPRGR